MSNLLICRTKKRLKKSAGYEGAVAGAGKNVQEFDYLEFLPKNQHTNNLCSVGVKWPELVNRNH